MHFAQGRFKKQQNQLRKQSAWMYDLSKQVEATQVNIDKSTILKLMNSNQGNTWKHLTTPGNTCWDLKCLTQVFYFDLHTQLEDSQKKLMIYISKIK